MSIDMYLFDSDHQASDVSQVLQNRIDAYASIQSALGEFVGNSPNLSGQAYETAKKYSELVLIPLLKGCILIDEAIKEACFELPNTYRSQVDSVDLKESELVEQISKAESIINQYKNLITVEYIRENPNYAYISNIKKEEYNNLRVKKKLEEKLYKLREFNDYSTKIFERVFFLGESINEGIREAKSLWDSSTSSYNLGLLNNSWTLSINEEWNKREKTLEPNLDEESKSLLKLAEDDLNSGKISPQIFTYIKSAIINGISTVIYEVAKTKVTDKAVEAFTQKAIEWLTYNAQNMNYALVPALANGGNAIMSINVNPIYSSFVSSFARYAGPIIGGAVDYSMQVNQGESSGHALVKTGAHFVINLLGAEIGSYMGTVFGFSLFVPFAGFIPPVLIGGAAGVLMATAVSIAFDVVYDGILKPLIENPKEYIDSIGKSISQGIDNVGDAVFSFVNSLGTVFN